MSLSLAGVRWGERPLPGKVVLLSFDPQMSAFPGFVRFSGELLENKDPEVEA